MSPMIKRLFLSALPLIVLVCSCKTSPVTNDEEGRYGLVVDIGPYSITMEVTDSDGNNLFVSETPGNWLNSSFSATFEGESYSFPSEDTKEYCVPISGLSVQQLGDPPKTALCFGELNGQDTRTSDLTLSWPDGTSDVITLKHKCSSGEDGLPILETSYSLNGYPVSAPIPLVKTPIAT